MTTSATSNQLRSICLVTVGRSDAGIWKPVADALAPAFDCGTVVSGAHLTAGETSTRQDAERIGLPIWAEVVCSPTDSTHTAMAHATGSAVAGFSDALDRLRPDLLMVLGDRFEMFAATLAAALLNIPVAHLHGGELSLGAIDDSLRHAMTKLSHLHYVAAEPYRERVLQLGEEPWRVVFAGAPALDAIRSLPRLSPAELKEKVGMDPARGVVLVTLHPETLRSQDTASHVAAVLDALRGFPHPVVFTAPNADPGSQTIRKELLAFVANNQDAVFVENLGAQAYYSMMEHAVCMLGNSSSGILEAPSFQLPVINVGARQDGRLRAPNVVDVPFDAAAIRRALEEAVAPGNRQKLADSAGIFGNGRAGEIIREHLLGLDQLPPLIPKGFCDLKKAL